MCWLMSDQVPHRPAEASRARLPAVSGCRPQLGPTCWPWRRQRIAGILSGGPPAFSGKLAYRPPEYVNGSGRSCGSQLLGAFGSEHVPAFVIDTCPSPPVGETATLRPDSGELQPGSGTSGSSSRIWASWTCGRRPRHPPHRRLQSCSDMHLLDRSMTYILFVPTSCISSTSLVATCYPKTRRRRSCCVVRLAFQAPKFNKTNADLAGFKRTAERMGEIAGPSAQPHPDGR